MAARPVAARPVAARPVATEPVATKFVLRRKSKGFDEPFEFTSRQGKSSPKSDATAAFRTVSTTVSAPISGAAISTANRSSGFPSLPNSPLG